MEKDSVRYDDSQRGTARIRRRLLHAEAADRLRDMILDGEIAPGDRVVESTLCEVLGISRTPLREAMRVLEAEGLIEMKPNRGAWVTAIQPREILELFEVVANLERAAVELASERMTDKEFEALNRLHGRMRRCYQDRRRQEYFKLNHEIHHMIVDLSGNSILAATHASLMVKARRARYMALMSEERWDEAMGEHEDVMAALATRDRGKAGEIMRRHVLRAGEVVCEKLNQGAVHDTGGKRRKQ